MKLENTTQAEIQLVGEEGTSTLRSAVLRSLNFPNRRIRTRTYGVWEGSRRVILSYSLSRLVRPTWAVVRVRLQRSRSNRLYS